MSESTVSEKSPEETSLEVGTAPEGATSQVQSQAPPPPKMTPPPDGGLQAWLQVFAGFIGFFISWGVINAFGEYETYYLNTLLPGESPSTIAWIGSIQAFLVVGFSVITGRVLDAGKLRHVLLFGTFMMVFGLMMTSLSTKFYQLLLAQGFCVGIGCSCFFSSTVATVAPYFSKKRATAIGIAATGSSIGGVVYPIMARHLIAEVGFGWATRIIAFMILALAAIPLALLRSRVPPRKSGPWIDVPSLTDWPYVSIAIGMTVAFIGLYVPIFYVETFALHINASKNVSGYIVSILNAGSVLGRTVPNILADRYGSTNCLIPCIFGASVLCYCWIAVHNDVGLILFAALYGFVSGGLVSLPGSIIPNMTKDMSLLGTRLGMAFFMCAIGVLIGAPVGGAIIKAQNGDFLGTQLFAGTLAAVAVVLVTLSRQIQTKGAWKMKV